jgi:hypothetical protein
VTSRVFTFVRTPEDDLLDDLLAAALQHCNRLGLMMQPRSHFVSTATSVIEAFGTSLVSREEVDAWPGSQLHDGSKATRLTYAWNVKTATIFRSTARSLYDWINPDLPEDPHLLRADGSLWMGSTSIEHDAWLELRPAEHLSLESDHPLLMASLREG